MLFYLLVSNSILHAESTQQFSAMETLVGKPILEVLEIFSTQGFEIYYSSNFITPEMTVLTKPEYTESVQILEAILKPHGLDLKQVENRYFVVKTSTQPGAPPDTSLWVMIDGVRNETELEQVRVTTRPELALRKRYSADTFSFAPANPGKYAVTVTLDGYLPVTSYIDIELGNIEILSIGLEPGPLALETLAISASRYVLFSNSQFYIDQRAIQALPKLGEDPIRAVHRLQGTAASGFSSKSHIRGGLENETSIYLNGNELLEPFHIRDFHSLFSSIGASTVSAIQVYTGGFPAEFGDDMSGIMLLDSKMPEEPIHTELGLSVYNTSVLNSGFTSEGGMDWLVSARRSNLDLVLNEEIGEPNYFDVFASLGFNLDSDTRISANALYTDDDIVITIENDPSELEQSTSSSRYGSFWLNLEKSWNSVLSSSTSITSHEFFNRRIAMVHDPEELVSDVHDLRKVDKRSLRHTMVFEGPKNHSLHWGLEFSKQNATYEYTGKAEYFDFAAAYPDIQNPKAYEIYSKPSGHTYSLFLSDRFSITNQFSMELGVRWDKQTYTKPTSESQFSPRASFLYTIENNRNIRFSIGRYHQSQGIHELQVEDNIDHFFEPQQADHFIAGYQWRSPSDFEFRIEVYYKKYSQVAPRFENLFDPLQMTPELQPDRVRLDPQSADAKGLEFSVEYVGSETLNWWLSYSLSRASDSIDGRNELRSWDQLHALQFGLAWQYNSWEIGIATRIHTGWPGTGMSLGYDPEDDHYFPLPGVRNAEQFDTFANLDFRVSKQFNVGKGSLMGFFEVTNATNRNNPCCVDYGVKTDPEGNVTLKRKVEYWLPLMPSIGLLWEF